MGGAPPTSSIERIFKNCRKCSHMGLLQYQIRAAFFPDVSATSNKHAFKEEKTILLKPDNRGICLGKKKVLNEGSISEMTYPGQGEILGIVTKLLGFDRIMVKCQDGAERLCRIRGKMKRRVWIRESDIVIVSPWDFQTDTRGDVVWRYTHAQAENLRRKGLLTI